jgi:superfamily II helicase
MLPLKVERVEFGCEIGVEMVLVFGTKSGKCLVFGVKLIFELTDSGKCLVFGVKLILNL